MFYSYICFSSYLLIFQRVITRIIYYTNGITTNPYVYLSQEGNRYIDTFAANSNLVPFRNTVRYLTSSDHFSFVFIFNNIIGNILVFLPLGLLLPLLFRQFRNFTSVLITVTSLTIMVEFAQITLHIGQFDVDDIILNIIGGVTGFWLKKLIAEKTKIKSQLVIE
ncbi:VanZ family protein [Gracilibacillus ureilyticus]|uniref:VanZ family protein n=1 Tax=Gracilibacillus ureilyticus TaxID=531814 RepID=UPI001FE1EADC|nr:VanZ family protein [Gracilibacillus ureilyticus]